MRSIIRYFFVVLFLSATLACTLFSGNERCCKILFKEGEISNSFDYANSSLRELLRVLEIDTSSCDVTFNRGFLNQISAKRGKYLFDIQIKSYEEINESTINKSVADYLEFEIELVKIFDTENKRRIVNTCTDTLHFNAKK